MKNIIIASTLLLLTAVGTAHAQDKVKVEVFLDEIAEGHSPRRPVEGGSMIYEFDSDREEFGTTREYGISHLRGLGQLKELKRIRFFLSEIDLTNTLDIFLRDVPHLEVLEFSHSKLKAESTKFLDYLPNLKMVRMSVNTREEDPRVVLQIARALPKLKNFDVRGFQFNNFDFLKYLPAVEYIHLDNFINDPLPVFKLEHTLKLVTDLTIWGIEVRDLSFLQYLPNIESLTIRDGNLDDVPYGADIPKFTSRKKLREYQIKLWSSVPKLNDLSLAKELYPDPGVLEQTTKIKE